MERNGDETDEFRLYEHKKMNLPPHIDTDGRNGCNIKIEETGSEARYRVEGSNGRGAQD
jgi:hypothetical protein